MGGFHLAADRVMAEIVEHHVLEVPEAALGVGGGGRL